MIFTKILFLFWLFEVNILYMQIIESINISLITQSTLNLLNLIREPNTVIIYPKIEIDLNKILINYTYPVAILKLDKNTTLKQLKTKYDLHIIFINKLKEFESIILSIQGKPIWNPSRYYLIVFFGNEEIEPIFELSWHKYIFNIVVLQQIGKKMEMFTYYPYENGVCSDENLKKKHIDISGGKLSDIFPSKVPKELPGCELKATGNIFPPFVKNPFKNDSLSGGFEVAIVNELANLYKMTRFNVAVKDAFGIILDDGTYTGILKLLAEKECDVVYGHLIPNISNFNDLDTTIHFFQDLNAWHVPAAIQGKQWESLMMIFDPDLWIFLAAIFFTNMFFWWAFGNFSNDLKRYKSFGWCVLHSWYAMILGSIRMPKTLKMRLLVIFWTLFALLLTTIYQSHLVGILLKPVHEHQIATAEEMVESPLKIIYIHDYIQGFKYSGKKINLEILEKGHLLTYLEYKYTKEKSTFLDEYAFIGSITNTKYLLLRNFSRPNGEPKVYVFKNIEFIHPLVMYARKGYPLLDRFNELILNVMANGLMAKWVKDSTSFVPQIMSDELQDFSIDHLIGAFYLLFTGLVLSWVAFIGEIIVFKCNHEFITKLYLKHRQFNH